jgi:hypothetical protein
MVKNEAALAKFQGIRKLVIHLDARQSMLSKNDKLAMALNCLHPVRDGAKATNPHMIETICFVIDGGILFTRFNYALTSPTLYGHHGRRAELLGKKLTPADKKQIAFQVTSTEKLIATALLGLRNIKNVVFDASPRSCRIEGAFREMLELTLVCVPEFPGHVPISSRGSNHPYATVGFDREGNFRSAAYDADPNINSYAPGEQLDTDHIDENDGLTLYNMVPIIPQTRDQMYDLEVELDSMPSDLQDIYLGWKV